MKACWRWLEPKKPLVWGWHIDAILVHLEAALRGEITELVINVPPRHIKPLVVDTNILRGDGSRVQLKDILPGDLVITHLGRPRRVLEVAEQGELECVEIETHHGRIIRTALDHPFLTPKGWVDAGDLTVGDTLAVVLSDPGEEEPRPPAGSLLAFTQGDEAERPDEEFRLAGYIIGDGAVTFGAPRTGKRGRTYLPMNCNIHCEDDEERADIVHCTERLGFGASIAGGTTFAAGKRVNLTKGARAWVEAVGMAGKGSWTKRVPDFVFRAPNAKIAHFIGAYFACDGSLSKKGGVRKDLCITFTSVNRLLCEDVQHLLARMGIPARIRRRDMKPGHGFSKDPEGYTFYNLEITSEDGAARFVDQMPVFHGKRARLAAWAPKRKQFDGRYMPDPIVAIRPIGRHPCRCLHVEQDHSFTAEDVAVHNSTLTCVIAPTWLWTWMPEARLLTTSYGLNLALRDASRSRKLINSPWYQDTFPDTRLDRTQTAKGRYDTTTGGWRVAGSVQSVGTGEGGTAVLIDDPLRAGDADSPVKRQENLDWYSETLPTRLDDPNHGTRIVIMQRLHDQDLTGFILAEKNPETVHLMLPARFDPQRACATPWFRDPRKERGEPLWPERFDDTALKRLERSMTPRAVAAQLDQLPNVAGGSIFRRAWWKIWTEGKPPKCEAIVVSHDPAMKEGQENSRWACQVWGIFRTDTDKPKTSMPERHPKLSFASLVKQSRWVEEQGRPDFSAILLDAWAEHITYPDAKRKLMATVHEWTLDHVAPDFVLIEDKAAGPALIRELTDANIQGVMPFNPGRMSKLQRANLVSDLWFTGRMWVLGRRMPDGKRSDAILPPPLEAVVSEMALFPAGEFDDHVDAATQAADLMRTQGWLSIDTDQEEDDEARPGPEVARTPVYG